MRIHRHVNRVPEGIRRKGRVLKRPHATLTIWPPRQGHRRPEFCSAAEGWSEDRGRSGDV